MRASSRGEDETERETGEGESGRTIRRARGARMDERRGREIGQSLSRLFDGARRETIVGRRALRFDGARTSRRRKVSRFRLASVSPSSRLRLTFVDPTRPAWVPRPGFFVVDRRRRIPTGVFSLGAPSPCASTSVRASALFAAPRSSLARPSAAMRSFTVGGAVSSSPESSPDVSGVAAAADMQPDGRRPRFPRPRHPRDRRARGASALRPSRRAPSRILRRTPPPPRRSQMRQATQPRRRPRLARATHLCGSSRAKAIRRSVSTLP